MPDVFGYKKDKQVGGLSTPSAVVVRVDGKDLQLAQSADLRYRREVRPVFVLGSDQVYMQPGPASGQLQVQRIIGEQGALSGFAVNDPCKVVNIEITGSGEAASCSKNFGSLTCTGCMLAEVGVQANVNGVIVTDSATWIVGGVQGQK